MRAFVCLSVSKILKNAWMDLDEMLHVDRCWDMEELLSPIRIIVWMLESDYFLRYCMHCNAQNFITLYYITVFSARPTTTRVGLAVQMSTMMLKTRSVKIKSR